MSTAGLPINPFLVRSMMEMDEWLSNFPMAAMQKGRGVKKTREMFNMLGIFCDDVNLLLLESHNFKSTQADIWRKKDLVAKVAELNCPHPGVYVKSSKETWFSCLRNFVSLTRNGAVAAATGAGAAASPVDASVEEARWLVDWEGRFQSRNRSDDRKVWLRSLTKTEFCSRYKDPKTTERQMRACTDLKTQIQYFRNKHSNYPLEMIPSRMGMPKFFIPPFPLELLLNGKRSLVASSSLRPSNASLSVFNVPTGDVCGSSRFLASSSQGNDSDYNLRTSPANIPPPSETQQSQRKRRYVHPAAQQCPSDDPTRERMITQAPMIPKTLRHGERQLMELVEGLRREVDALFDVCCECPVMVTGMWHYCDARSCSAGRSSELPVDLDPPPCGARQFTQHYTKDLVDFMGSDDQGEMSEQTIGWLKKLCQRIYVIFVHFEKYHYDRFTWFKGEIRLCRLFHVFALDNGLIRPEELTVRLVKDIQTPFHTITADTMMNPSRWLTFSDV
ncbi:hypothetical protein BV898_09558 [Hypsibius exemplaris]|uniref:Uncharacterized protein n=1 Tax=Hypsibius exemplaris TaxID=2072580 RepID=A0A1W0WM25_HYPEX|nr:hypothetical protein BV898_09558 [Hypsibius exemplaris]